MAVIALGVKNELLNKMLRDTAPASYRFTSLRAEAQSAGNFWNLSLPWNAPVDGMAAITGPASMVVGGGAPVYPITRVYAQDVAVPVDNLVFSVSAPAECIFADLDGPGVPVIAQFSVRLPKANGSVKLNTALVNALLTRWLNLSSGSLGAVGTVKVYTGAAPATADDPATGTELLSFSTSTGTWNASTNNASTLVSALTAAGLATATAGYARHSWTVSSIVFTVQGSVGTPGQGADYTLDSLAVTQGQNRSLVEATYRFA